MLNRELQVSNWDMVRSRAIAVETVFIEHSREIKKKCSMYAGVQCIQVLSDWGSGEIETTAMVIRET